MPIYEYLCTSCGHMFEDVRPASQADDPEECPKCGKKKTERLMSAFATCGGGPGGSSSSCGSGGFS